MKKVITSVLLSGTLIVGCSSSQTAMTSDVITVEGRVNQRGNTPFQTWMVETESGNSYVLVMESTPGQYSSSKKYRVTGRLYKDQWNGKDYAHLEVAAITDVGM